MKPELRKDDEAMNKEHITARLRQVEERYENEMGCARRNRDNELIDIRSKCEHEEGFQKRYFALLGKDGEEVCPVCGLVKT